MRNKVKLNVIIALIATNWFLMVGCTTTSLKEPVSGVVYNIAIPAKNIQIIGIVRVETTVDSKGNGELITYDALLKEAERKGGNGLANIMIDKMENSSFGSTAITWYGSALAIKYTDENLPAGTPISIGGVPANAGTQSSSTTRGIRQ
jgi:hypothetical protein